MGKAIAMLSASAPVLDSLITHRASIDGWEQVFKDIEGGNAIKALFIPGA